LTTVLSAQIVIVAVDGWYELARSSARIARVRSAVVVVTASYCGSVHTRRICRIAPVVCAQVEIVAGEQHYVATLARIRIADVLCACIVVVAYCSRMSTLTGRWIARVVSAEVSVVAVEQWLIHAQTRGGVAVVERAVAIVIAHHVQHVCA